MVPIFWTSKYSQLQSSSAFLFGTTFDSQPLQAQSEEMLRSWLVLDGSGPNFRSPCRATFGGLWTRNNNCSSNEVDTIYGHLVASQRSQDTYIYLPPIGMAPFFVPLQLSVLKEHGFRIAYSDLNFHIYPLDWAPKLMSRGNQKKLGQWNRAGGKIFQSGISELATIYEVIRKNRLRLGVEPSISLENLTKLCEQFPDSYFLFTGKIKDAIAVVAVVVDVSPESLYVFFWADEIEFRNFSPVVAMCTELVNWSQTRGKTRLDLGIASQGGVINHGLATFKRNLGAIEETKPMMHYSMVR